MAEDFGIQLSITIPSGEQYEKGDMVNIRGRDAGEFQQNLSAFSTHMAEQAARVAQDIRAQYAVVKSLGGTTIEQTQNPSQAPSQPAQDAGGDPWGNQSGGQPAGPQNGYQQGEPNWYGQTGGNLPPQGPPPAQQQPQQQGPPQQTGIPTSPPPHLGPAPHCSHGEKRFLAKAYKGGKPGYWMAWACPAPRGDQTQHDLEFIRNS